MIQETRIFLNKSNSKWIVIGINPEEKIFDIDVWLGGEKCTPFKLGENGLTDLICMLAGHTYFKDEYWVSEICYHVFNRVFIRVFNRVCVFLGFSHPKQRSSMQTSPKNTLTMEKCAIQGSVVFKICDTVNPGAAIYLGIPTIEALLALRFELKLLISAKDAYAVQSVWGRIVDRLTLNPDADWFGDDVDKNEFVLISEIKSNFAELVSRDVASNI